MKEKEIEKCISALRVFDRNIIQNHVALLIELQDCGIESIEDALRICINITNIDGTKNGENFKSAKITARAKCPDCRVPMIAEVIDANCKAMQVAGKAGRGAYRAVLTCTNCMYQVYSRQTIYQLAVSTVSNNDRKRA